MSRRRLIAGGLGLAYGLSGVAFGLDGVTGSTTLFVFTGLATAVCFGLVVLRRWPTLHPLLLCLVALGAATMHGMSSYTGLGFAYVLPWLAVFSAGIPVVIAVAALDVAGIALASTTMNAPVAQTVGITLGLLFTFAFAVAIAQLALVRERTEAAASARAGEAVLAERQRLAREMHDVLAHSLSAQILHLEGARLLLEQGGPTEEVLQHVRRAGRLARAGLTETKQALHALRGDDIGVVALLDGLVQEFRAGTGTACDLTTTGDVSALPPAAELAVVRTAQEALTNVRKHAPGAACALSLTVSDGWCSLVVTDRGGPAVAAAGSGYGLVGMRERAELIGGTLTAAAGATGFRVHLAVPVG